MTSSNHQNKHTLPSSSALRFYKIITTTTLQRENLRIPYGFTKIHGDHVPNPLFLKPPDGKEWKIHWNKHEGDILFQKGWKEFSEYYSLAHGHMVWFEYDAKETCHFRVHLFNKNKVEIKYPFHRIQDEQHNLNQIRPEENSVEIPVDEQLPCKKRRPKSPMSRPQPPKKLRTNPSVDDVGRSSKLQNLPKFVQVKEEMDEEQEQLTSRIPNATNLRSKIPTFEVVMKSTYVEQYLYIPSQFAMKYLSTKTSNILLKVMDERRTWLVSYYFSRFGVGWKTFASDNNLKVGDICQFELTNSQPLTFKVHMKQPQGKKATKRNSLQTSPCTFTNDEALEEAEKFTSTLENPYFTLNLKTNNWRLYRPRVLKSFFNKNLCKPKETVMLKFRKKLWPVTLLSYPRESSNRLGAGWKLFAEERKLEAGNVCVFELINRKDAVLDVHIFGGHS